MQKLPSAELMKYIKLCVWVFKRRLTGEQIENFSATVPAAATDQHKILSKTFDFFAILNWWHGEVMAARGSPGGAVGGVVGGAVGGAREDWRSAFFPRLAGLRRQECFTDTRWATVGLYFHSANSNLWELGWVYRNDANSTSQSGKNLQKNLLLLDQESQMKLAIKFSTGPHDNTKARNDITFFSLSPTPHIHVPRRPC